jgi:hypothetical protein
LLERGLSKGQPSTADERKEVVEDFSSIRFLGEKRSFGEQFD